MEFEKKKKKKTQLLSKRFKKPKSDQNVSFQHNEIIAESPNVQIQWKWKEPTAGCSFSCYICLNHSHSRLTTNDYNTTNGSLILSHLLPCLSLSLPRSLTLALCLSVSLFLSLSLSLSLSRISGHEQFLCLKWGGCIIDVYKQILPGVMRTCNRMETVRVCHGSLRIHLN